MTHAKQLQVWVGRLILGLATLTLLACGTPESDAQQLVLTAKSYIARNQMREAALELKNALQENPDNAEARYLLGQINLEIGDMASAEKEFRRAASSGWGEAQVQVGLAKALINSSAFQEMIDEVEIKDSYPAVVRADLHGLRAVALASLGELDAARASLAAGAAIDAKAFQILKTTSQLQWVSGDIPGAASTLKQALAGYPDNPELLLLSARFSIQASDQANAAAAYRKVIEQDPAKILGVYGRQARLGLALLQILGNDLEQAKITMAPLFARNANDPEANYLGGMLAFKQGNFDQAEERLLKVLKVAPDHAQTWLLIGTVSYAQKNYEQAAYYIARYVSDAPENLGARKLLGRTYMMLGQPAEAQAALQQGLKESADDPELLALVGLSRMQGGMTDSGIERLEMAVKAAPDSTVIRSELAKAYLTSGDTDRAILELNTLLGEGGNQESAESLLVLAHLRAGNTAPAIDRALKILSRKPEDPAVLSLVGNVFAASNESAEARKYYNKALQLKPGFGPAIMSLARMEEQEGHPEKAAKLYRDLVAAGAESIGPQLALARLAESGGNPEEMLDWLEKARVQAPLDIKPRLLLAEHYLRTKQTFKADLLVKEAAKIAPNEPDLLALQGRVLMAERQFNKALSPFNELVSRAPDSVLARALLAENYLELGQINDARRHLRDVLEKQPNYLPALVLMSRVAQQSGNYDQALEYANQIQKVQPALNTGYELGGDAWMGRENYIEARAAYARAWQRQPTEALALKLSASARLSGKLDEATQPLVAWLEDHPDDVRAQQFLATTYQDLGQVSNAVQAYEKILAVDPENAVILNNLAWLYALEDDPRALGLAEKAHRNNPEDAGIQDTYGWILVQQGQFRKGRSLLNQALKKLSGVPEVRYHYAVALLKSGEEKEAHRLLGALLEEAPTFEGREEAEMLLRQAFQ